MGVQWLQYACGGEQAAATEALQRICREPSCASAVLLETHAPADRTPSSQAAAVRGRAAMLCRVAALRDKKTAVAAGAWDAAATETELRACGAFEAAAALMELLAARGDESATATDLPVRPGLRADASLSASWSTTCHVGYASRGRAADRVAECGNELVTDECAVTLYTLARLSKCPSATRAASLAAGESL